MTALPLEDQDIDAVSVEDVGECVASIFNKQKVYAGKTVGITAGRLTMKAIVEAFNKNFDHRKFEDPKVISMGISMIFILHIYDLS